MIWHILTKLHPNGSTHSKVVTSYRFFQRVAIELEIYAGFAFSENTKISARYTFPNPFDLIFAFFSLVALVASLHIKFEVSSSNHSRDKEGVPKFQK